MGDPVNLVMGKPGKFVHFLGTPSGTVLPPGSLSWAINPPSTGTDPSPLTVALMDSSNIGTGDGKTLAISITSPGTPSPSNANWGVTATWTPTDTTIAPLVDFVPVTVSLPYATGMDWTIENGI